MKDENTAQAAALIWELWQNHRVANALPEAVRPSTRAQGYAIQAGLDRLSGGTCVGWKIAATSAAGQSHIGVSGPLAGRIFASRVFSNDAQVSLLGNRMLVAEPEFAFRFGSAVAPRSTPYETREIMGTVESLHLALELPNSRFCDFAKVGEPTLIADNACAHELVLGKAVEADWRTLDFSRHEVHAKVGRRYERQGIGANVLGDPRVALTWIVNELGSLGITLRPGQFVTTGVCMVPLEIEPGDEVLADFGKLGTVQLACAP